MKLSIKQNYFTIFLIIGLVCLSSSIYGQTKIIESDNAKEVIERSEAEIQAEELIESGNEHFAGKNLETAVQDYTKAIKLYPKGFLAYKYRANAYELLGKKALAKVDRQKAKKLETAVPNVISTAPSNKKEWARESIIWGNKHFVEKNYKSAIESYTQAIENDPQNSKAHEYRANVYETIGKKDLAEADRKKVAGLSDSNQ